MARALHLIPGPGLKLTWHPESDDHYGCALIFAVFSGSLTIIGYREAVPWMIFVGWALAPVALYCLRVSQTTILPSAGLVIFELIFFGCARPYRRTRPLRDFTAVVRKLSTSDEGDTVFVGLRPATGRVIWLRYYTGHALARSSFESRRIATATGLPVEEVS